VLWSGPENAESISGGPAQDFVSAIRTGQPPRTTLENALIFQQIADAVYESAASGHAVEIADGDRNS
jgi:predicted dehydrogenase